MTIIGHYITCLEIFKKPTQSSILIQGNDVDRSTMYQQIHDFITNCNGEQVRFGPDLCKHI